MKSRSQNKAFFTLLTTTRTNHS